MKERYCLTQDFRLSASPEIYTIFIESTGVIWCFLLFYAILQEETIMHNSIYEVSRSPVPASQRARAGNMPDWFFERVCDYAENPTPRQREEALGSLIQDSWTLLHQRRRKIFPVPKDQGGVLPDPLRVFPGRR